MSISDEPGDANVQTNITACLQVLRYIPSSSMWRFEVNPHHDSSSYWCTFKGATVQQRRNPGTHAWPTSGPAMNLAYVSTPSDVKTEVSVWANPPLPDPDPDPWNSGWEQMNNRRGWMHWSRHTPLLFFLPKINACAAWMNSLKH